MCMPGSPEHDAWMKGEEAYNAFLKEQDAKNAEGTEQQFDRSVEQTEDDDEG